MPYKAECVILGLACLTSQHDTQKKQTYTQCNHTRTLSINGDSVNSAQAHKFLCTDNMPVWLSTPPLLLGMGARGMGKLLALESDDH